MQIGQIPETSPRPRLPPLTWHHQSAGLPVHAARALKLAAPRRSPSRTSCLPARSVPPSLVAASLLAFQLRNTATGRAVSSPILAFTFALALSNVGLMPAAHAAYDLAATAALPLSVSLGLLSAGSPRAKMDADPVGGGDLRPMALAFAIGAAGTILGALAAFMLVVRTGQLPRPAAACAAGLMAATYIGGSANFFGVAQATAAEVHGTLLPSLLAADGAHRRVPPRAHCCCAVAQAAARLS